MASAPDKVNGMVVLGQFGKTHGIKGWLRLNSFTEPATNILDYPELRTKIAGLWKVLEIDQCREQPNGLLVHVEGFDNPETVRDLIGLELSVPIEMLPALQDDEFYWHQLLGAQVINQQQQCFGEVTKVLETGANDVLVITPSEASLDDRERLIPYLKDSVIKKVDVAGKTISVDWEADYLD